MVWWDAILVGGLVTTAVAWVARSAIRNIAGRPNCSRCSSCATTAQNEHLFAKESGAFVPLVVDRSGRDVPVREKRSARVSGALEHSGAESMRKKTGDPSSVGKTADHPMRTVPRWDTA